MKSAKARDNDLKGAFAHHKNSAMREKIIYFDFLYCKYFFFARYGTFFFFLI